MGRLVLEFPPAGAVDQTEQKRNLLGGFHLLKQSVIFNISTFEQIRRKFLVGEAMTLGLPPMVCSDRNTNDSKRGFTRNPSINASAGIRPRVILPGAKETVAYVLDVM